MIYLIHTTQHPRPHLCRLAFIAHDFHHWGHRIDTYPDESPYMAELRWREVFGNPAEHVRIGILEIWAREVISRRCCSAAEPGAASLASPVSPASPAPPAREAGDGGGELAGGGRLARASRMVQDFVVGIAAFDKPGSQHAALPDDRRALPASPAGLVSKYLRLVKKMRHRQNATQPPGLASGFLVADEVYLEFRFHKSLKLEHLAHAAMVAMGEGRMGSVERDARTGYTKVTLLVEVGDCIMSPCEDVETMDPVPRYEIVEFPPAYM